MFLRYSVRSGVRPYPSPYHRLVLEVLPTCPQRRSSIRRFSRPPLKTWKQSVTSSNPSFRNVATASVSTRLLEEETLPGYDHDDFYSVRLGDWIVGQYHVIGKLGYGANSTVWFCRDEHENQYVAVKIYIRTPPGRTNREKALYEHLAKSTTTHPGSQFIRPALDMFDLVSSSGSNYVCLVYPLLQTTLFAFQRPHGSPQALPEELVKSVLKSLLLALDFLHTEANATHCDYEEAETRNPSLRKVLDEERTIYTPRDFRRPKDHAYGTPVLCGFGEARIGAPHAYAEIQPEIYKAPEILMQFEWGHGVDIWNAGCLLWEMLEAEHLFDGSDSEGLHNNRCHMKEMVDLLGKPPMAFLRRSEHSSHLFDEKGNWIAEPPITALSLENRAKHIEGVSKAEILDFLKSMLCWLPEERKSARELLEHAWLSECED